LVLITPQILSAEPFNRTYKCRASFSYWL